MNSDKQQAKAAAEFAERWKGGRSKDFSQIAGVKDSYVFADDWDMSDGAKPPLWMLGFLY